MKMISNKLAVSGPASPEFEGVPIPIGIPFGIYPLVQGRHGGVLVPTFAQSQDYGLGLEGLGYYKVMNDYWDVTARTNLYSYGGWSLNLNPRYQKRYRYTGNFNLTFQNTKALNRSYVDYGGTTPTTGDEFNVTKSFMLNWTHSQDSRSRPGTSFGANVNFGSTKYNQTVLNNPYLNYQNQLTSSISYSKDFKGKANIALTANHNQNNALHLVNINLPNLNGTVVTMFPFKKKEQIGQPKWYENIGIGYSGNLNNQFSFYDTAYSFKKMLDTIQWSAAHSIPITLSLPAMGPVTLAPSVSFQEHWFGQQIFRTWDDKEKKLDTSIHKGFYAARQVSFGMSASTRIFGTYGLGTTKIRHEVRPTVSVSYTPDMNSQNYYNVQVDTLGNKLRFSKFDGIPPGAFQEGAFGGLSFGIDNLLEMKVKDKKDTAATAFKKVKLLDGFGFSSSYNLLADSFALSPFSLYARSTLFNVINITSSATLDPYQINQYGYRINKFAWSKGSLGRITNGSVAISTQFKSKPRDGRSDSARTPVDPFMTPDEQQRQLQYARANPAEYTDFNIPWTLSLSYSFSFSKQLQTDTTGAYSYQTITSSNINFNGDFSLTPKWKVGATGYLNVTNGSLQQLSMFVTREMHCWQLAVNVNPIGIYRSFSITINPKSGILRDLRINRSRTFSNY
ncbi:hypothetical protein F5148DRAFT_1295867 [Russula earlei]|uniref:Uncharacterized protein n=1 Tax=Russula earlei TaxID=71964 RepID=A0ACC0TQN6_9AGAM|nr:hypothetical protein F5148DRAFT_1295867 [Russula earlei]